jgi:hypothetical protein
MLLTKIMQNQTEEVKNNIYIYIYDYKCKIK